MTAMGHVCECKKCKKVDRVSIAGCAEGCRCFCGDAMRAPLLWWKLSARDGSKERLRVFINERLDAMRFPPGTATLLDEWRWDRLLQLRDELGGLAFDDARVQWGLFDEIERGVGFRYWYKQRVRKEAVGTLDEQFIVRMLKSELSEGSDLTDDDFADFRMLPEIEREQLRFKWCPRADERVERVGPCDCDPKEWRPPLDRLQKQIRCGSCGGQWFGDFETMKATARRVRESSPKVSKTLTEPERLERIAIELKIGEAVELKVEQPPQIRKIRASSFYGEIGSSDNVMDFQSAYPDADKISKKVYESLATEKLANHFPLEPESLRWEDYQISAPIPKKFEIGPFENDLRKPRGDSLSADYNDTWKLACEGLEAIRKKAIQGRQIVALIVDDPLKEKP